MSQRTVQPLTELPPGTTATVVSLAGGRAFQNRLVSMGLRVGGDVTVLSGRSGFGGPVLVAAGDTRLAIGRGMARRILVATAGGH